MVTNKFIPALAAATIGLVGCGSQSEQQPVKPEPTAHQLQVIKDTILADLKRTDASRTKAFNEHNAQSLDGKGRIHYSAAANVITIHVKAPTLELPDWFARDVRGERLKSKFDSAYNNQFYSERNQPMTDEKLIRQVESGLINSGDSGIRFNNAAGSAVVNIASGRVCITNAAHKEDCIDKRTVDPQTQLGRDINLAYRKLNLN